MIFDFTETENYSCPGQTTAAFSKVIFDLSGHQTVEFVDPCQFICFGSKFSYIPGGRLASKSWHIRELQQLDEQSSQPIRNNVTNFTGVAAIFDCCDLTICASGILKCSDFHKYTALLKV